MGFSHAEFVKQMFVWLTLWATHVGTVKSSYVGLRANAEPDTVHGQVMLSTLVVRSCRSVVPDVHYVLHTCGKHGGS